MSKLTLIHDLNRGFTPADGYTRHFISKKSLEELRDLIRHNPDSALNVIEIALTSRQALKKKTKVGRQDTT